MCEPNAHGFQNNTTNSAIKVCKRTKVFCRVNTVPDPDLEIRGGGGGGDGHPGPQIRGVPGLQKFFFSLSGLRLV